MPGPGPRWANEQWTPFDGYGGDNRTITITFEEVNGGAWPAGRQGWTSRVLWDGVAYDVPYTGGKLGAGGKRNATVDVVVVPDAAAHTLVLETDVGGVEFETDKGNNQVSVAVYFFDERGRAWQGGKGE